MFLVPLCMTCMHSKLNSGNGKECKEQKKMEIILMSDQRVNDQN